MKKYNKWELNIIRKYFKRGKIPKSISDIDQKLLNPMLSNDIKALLDIAISKISNNEDISLIVDNIVQYEKEMNKSKDINKNLRSAISEKLMDDETLLKAQLKAFREILNDSNFNNGLDIYNEKGELHSKKK